MAALTTQAEVDALTNEYFVQDDAGNTDWPTNTLSSALPSGYRARVASLSQKIQDDLVDLLDTATTAL
jgi:hypothetical protein